MSSTLTDEDISRIADALSVRLTHGEGAAAVARAAAFTAVQEYDAKAWSRLGYNVANDDHVERLRKNFAFMETLREGSTNLASAITKAVAIAIVLAILAWIALGAKTSIGHGLK